ncbi:hypothetical protein LEP1GSC018_1354 [Leptospira kirschneri str. 2008720114]|uniref:Uncharacterized protein n=1 Tax=Leptospira kirschneri serovar Bulgarica str. Nikolaevo TaxID=1240687 RepID=M6FKT4_9LEPT|nr:hypothetical protein LEP1GSC018_1354 [Leptospira kirschneri str. 2008720114]EMK23391.1 hypothetical protein LEP1GSC008_1734 [Leptospira kirschneri serovar Bulgarica str. Nikolaevo]KON78437.1 Uncharacterized protein NV38_0000815 [Leptospira kirschneri serovar Mozdok]NDK04546.1 hypothetical protein [Leptospira kirschneri serovar Mozdok]
MENSLFRSGTVFSIVLYSGVRKFFEKEGSNEERGPVLQVESRQILISIQSFKRMFSIYSTLNLLAVTGEFC